MEWGAEDTSRRNTWRLAYVFSSPIDARRFPQIALDSSIAKIPRPGEAIVLLVITNLSKTYSSLDEFTSIQASTNSQPDEAPGVIHWTTDTASWRRDWPLTHSDLSTTGDKFRREAEAIISLKVKS